MRKFSPEEEAYFIEKVREAEEENIWYTEEEFDQWLEKYEKEYEEKRREEQLRRNIKLNIPNVINRISKRFIRA